MRKKINAAAGRVAKGATGRARRLVGKTKRGLCAAVEATKKAARKTRDEICESKWFGLGIVVIFTFLTAVYMLMPAILAGYYYCSIIALMNFNDNVLTMLIVPLSVEQFILIFSGRWFYREAMRFETGNEKGNRVVREVATKWLVCCYCLCFVIEKICKIPAIRLYSLSTSKYAALIRYISVVAELLTKPCKKELGEDADKKIEKILPFMRKKPQVKIP